MGQHFQPTPRQDAADAAVPNLPPRYELLEELERGAMGAVYRARHRALRRDVAVKVIHPHFATSQTFVSALLREARAAAQIDHPHVVRALDFDRDRSGRFFMVMELVEGESLADLLERRPRPPAEWVIQVASQVLAALEAAHQRGIVHRDVKPGNVLVQRTVDDDGRARDLVKVCDFGIASVSGMCLHDDRGRPVTLTGTLCGTPGYLAPEQLAAREVDHRADLYAVGAMLYEMLTGRLVREGELALTLNERGEPAPFPTPSSLCPGLDPRLERVVMRALRADPAERPTSARAMRAELLACLPGRQRAGSGAPALEGLRPTPPRIPTPIVPPEARQAPPESAVMRRANADEVGADEAFDRLQREPRGRPRRGARYAFAGALLIAASATLVLAGPTGLGAAMTSAGARAQDVLHTMQDAMRPQQEVTDR